VGIGVLEEDYSSEWALEEDYSSKWASSFQTFVHQQKGAIRIVTDFRKLNLLLKRHPFPILKIGDIQYLKTLSLVICKNKSLNFLIFKSIL
jgi:hypothetical protein